MEQGRIREAAFYVGETGVAECRERVEEREYDFVLQAHVQLAVDAEKECPGSQRLNQQGEPQDVEQRRHQCADCLRRDDVLHHQLVVYRCIAAEKEGEEACEGHHSESSGLDEESEHGQSRE